MRGRPWLRLRTRPGETRDVAGPSPAPPNEGRLRARISWAVVVCPFPPRGGNQGHTAPPSDFSPTPVFSPLRWRARRCRGFFGSAVSGLGVPPRRTGWWSYTYALGRLLRADETSADRYAQRRVGRVIHAHRDVRRRSALVACRPAVRVRGRRARYRVGAIGEYALGHPGAQMCAYVRVC